MNASDIDLIAVTSKPGLIGSLIVGVNFAKGLSIALNKPLICIDHILGHLYSPLMTEKLEYPFLSLILSGGHTILTKNKIILMISKYLAVLLMMLMVKLLTK